MNWGRYGIEQRRGLGGQGWQDGGGAAPVKDWSTHTAARFIFENIMTRFGCPLSLTSEQGAHFVSQAIATFIYFEPLPPSYRESS